MQESRAKYAHIVGNGTSDSSRSNAHTLDWYGNAWFAGSIFMGGTGQDDGNAVEVATKQDVEELRALLESMNKKDRWHFHERSEFIGYTDGTYYFDPTGTYSPNPVMPLSEGLYWNGGRNINDGVYYSGSASQQYMCTLSNVTDNGLTLTTGNGTDLFIAIPFHLKAGETFTAEYNTDTHDRGGYQIFNPDGTYREAVMEQTIGAGEKVRTYTAEDECWYVWRQGLYDANASVTLSNIRVTIE